MRARLPLLAALGLLAACGHRNPPVASGASAAAGAIISYRVAGNDVTQANIAAARQCRQYGATARLQGIQSSSSGKIAVYRCIAAATSGGPAPEAAAPAAPSQGTPGYGATAPPIQCADPLHQARPGGTDYKGPPVPQCPPKD